MLDDSAYVYRYDVCVRGGWCVWCAFRKKKERALTASAQQVAHLHSRECYYYYY